MEDPISSFIHSIEPRLNQIDIDRKDDLKLLAELINVHLTESGRCALTIICTHNSRRSQLTEFLLRQIFYYYNISGIHTYSGGTEATAFNHRMVKALADHGFLFEKSGDIDNPTYSYTSESQSLSQSMFSKAYHHDFNPQKDFIAVMVCDHADEHCPIVHGASHRVSLPYLDPKAADDTPQEEKAYYEKVSEIGTEMLYLCQLVSEMMD